ncbi:MAG: hypothetical protein M3401_12095 [Actinomycetota bacterium]|nr:hypothetical protein [Actinomycetota bacterium]
MPRRLPILTTGPPLALIALLTAAGVVTYPVVGDGDRVASTSGKHLRSALKIRGNLPRRLTPGTSQPLNLRISNRTRHRLRITRITVSLKVDAAHRRAGCSRTRSFRVTRLQRRQYSILVLPRRTRSLRALRVRPLPRVRMLNLRTNQDACKGAKLRLRYRGRARRWLRIHSP